MYAHTTKQRALLLLVVLSRGVIISDAPIHAARTPAVASSTYPTFLAPAPPPHKQTAALPHLPAATPPRHPPPPSRLPPFASSLPPTTVPSTIPTQPPHPTTPYDGGGCGCSDQVGEVMGKPASHQFHYKRKEKKSAAAAEEDAAEEVDEGEPIYAEGGQYIEFPSNEPDADDEEEGGLRKPKAKSGGFQSMGLSAEVYKSVMRKGYRVPTPIQRRAIPVLMAGQDVAAMARTGSGKTAAFVLPMLHKLKAHCTIVGVRALVLSPTRELALQTHKFCGELSHFVKPPLRFALMVGGDSIDEQFEMLSRNPDVIVGTPGRLQHVLADAQLSLSRVEYLVFDEADRLFEMGFASQLDAIISACPESRQTALFSATMPSLLADFTRAKLHEPQLIRLDLETKISDTLEVHFFKVRPQEKLGALQLVLSRLLGQQEQTIVFASTRHHVELLQELLSATGFACSSIYGTLDPAARKIALGKFRAGKSKVLIVTDVAARGIDVPLLDNVVNFDFPSKPKLFVHRAGRAGRAGRPGKAVSLVEPEELPFLMDLKLYLGRTLHAVPADHRVAAAEEGEIDVSTIVLARFPTTLLETEVEFVQSHLSASDELQDLLGVASRALQMVRKTRGHASRASVALAKELPTELGVHPLLAGSSLDVDAEVRRAAFLKDLKSFRPADDSRAVSSGIKVRRGQPSGEALAAEALECGAARAEAAGARGGAEAPHEARGRAQLSKKKRKREAADFIDQNFYLSYEKPLDSAKNEVERADRYLRVNAGESRAWSQLDNAVMDLVEDERDGVAKKRSILRWDQKKRKFVRETLGQTGIGATDSLAGKDKKRRRDESGRLIDTSEDKNLYEVWRKSSKKRIPMPGEKEVEGSGDGFRGASRHTKNGRRWHVATKPLPNANVKSEIKTDAQIAKARKLKAKKAGKGGGKGGSSGKGAGGKGSTKGAGGKGSGKALRAERDRHAVGKWVRSQLCPCS
ncbi:hypothetical protein AB1Y20_004911 [Prymnesium parvum]|uniref:RNA helicase n=1 Tax=Prymnesium parvum TaxID=97485 RepID=A0AB34IXF3_PRYPA